MAADTAATPGGKTTGGAVPTAPPPHTEGKPPHMPSAPTGHGAAVSGPASAAAARVLTPDALRFLATLAREFEPRRQALLARRQAVQARMHAGQRPEFPPHSRVIREGQWAIDPLPADLQDRRVEIIAPPARATLVEALYSGARTCIADFEDSHAPTWEATLQGQVSLMDAVDGSIAATPPEGGPGRLAARPATLGVRPRGWHLDEKHVRLDDRPVAAGLFDFGIYFFHNARGLAAKGSGPYFDLPKLENRLEARLWNEIFDRAQKLLAIPRGSIKATVLIETVPAAFEADEILYELRHHAAGLACGRRDYLFSFIKKFRRDPDCLLPDRTGIALASPCLRACSRMVIRTGHRRGAHALGGLAARIPIPDDPARNAAALAAVREDAAREAADGHDGTRVAHPGMVAPAREAFDRLMPTPNQIARRREDVRVTADDLLRCPTGAITAEGLRKNVRVGIQYLAGWLAGHGRVPIDHSLEDLATAEIARSQVWQWLHHPRAVLADGRQVTETLVRQVMAGELDALRERLGAAAFDGGGYTRAAQLFAEIATREELDDFLTLRACDLLD